jgi:hypothetical protein
LSETHVSSLNDLTSERNNIKLEKDVIENELKTIKELYSKLIDEKSLLSIELNVLKQDTTTAEKLNKVFNAVLDGRDSKVNIIDFLIIVDNRC